MYDLVSSLIGEDFSYLFCLQMHGQSKKKIEVYVPTRLAFNFSWMASTYCDDLGLSSLPLAKATQNLNSAMLEAATLSWYLEKLLEAIPSGAKAN